MASPTRKKAIRPPEITSSTIHRIISWYLNGKGGVGKSTAAHAEIDRSLRAGHDVIVVETDITNADVGLVYKNQSTTEGRVQVIRQEMDTREGYKNGLRLINQLRTENKKIVINGRAGNSEQIREFGAFTKGLELADSGSVRVRWVINPYRDSIGLLKQLLDVAPTLHVDVLKPCSWGEDRHYRLYNESPTSRLVADRGGVALMFPKFHPDQLFGFYVDRRSLEEQHALLDSFDQMEIDEVRRNFDDFFRRLDALDDGSGSEE